MILPLQSLGKVSSVSITAKNILPAQARIAIGSQLNSPRLSVSNPRLWGGLGFECNSLYCTCSGDDDCNDLFSTNACGAGSSALCTGSGDTARCVCIRR
jgi:hypothetical protein